MAAICCCNPVKWPRSKEGKPVILIRAYVRQQAGFLAAAAQEQLDKHLDQLAVYNLPILTDTEVKELQDYLAKVRDVDNLPGFPCNIVWPAVPQTLRKMVIT